MSDKYGRTEIMLKVMSSRAIIPLLALALILAPLLVQNPAPASGSPILSITAPSARDPGGRFVDEMKVGDEITLISTILSAGQADQPFTAIIDVRDANDVSTHIALVEGIAPHDGKFDLTNAWVPRQAGSYTVRMFLITGFDNTEILSTVKTSSIEVKTSARDEISGIANFATKWDEVYYTVYFSILDRTMNQTTYDGRATLSIADATGQVRYSGSVSVEKSDFRMYARTWGDEQKVLAFVWQFPASDVKKGVREGIAKLTFTALDGNIFTASTPIHLRQLTGDEIIQAYENVYQRSAVNVDRTIIEGDFKLSLHRVGHYSHLANGTSGKQITHFRADFDIASLSSEKLSLPTLFYIVDDNANRYNEVAFNGTLQSGSDLDPHSSISGFKLFDDVRDGASWVKIIVVGLDGPDKILELSVDLK